MASPMVPANKILKKMQSKKSHSWWWDSHISPKNNKWLSDNLEEMDRSVKRMLKLIEEDADSFAKKAEMYYQRRPELISLVEEFYRMYRLLAERYDHVTGELRKNIPSDLQSQGSGVSDSLSELPSAWPSPGPDQKLARHKSGPRAAGFEFFLGSGGSNSDLNQKEGDESSTLTDSEPESEDSSVNNFSILFGNGVDQGLTRKMVELEMELRETKEKLQMQQDENIDGSYRGARSDFEDLLARNAAYEHELKTANERLQSSEEEISKLNAELQRYKSSKLFNGYQGESILSAKDETKTRKAMNVASQPEEYTDGVEAEALDPNSRIQSLAEELRITKERLQGSEREITSLRCQLEAAPPPDKINSLENQLALAHTDVNNWKSKLNAEKREVSKLQERIARLKTSLSDRDHEVRELKIAVSDAEQKIFPEKAQIKADISKLLEERKSLDEQLRELESRGRALEDEIRTLQIEKMETEKRLYYEIEQLKADIAERDNHIQDLDYSLEALSSVRDELNVKIRALKVELNSRDDRIDEMDKHLQQLYMEHVELIAGADETHKLVDELRSKAKGLEEEVERQRNIALETAEEKREAIRQLCFSLEHYRNGYQMLRHAFTGHKRVPVLAA